MKKIILTFLFVLISICAYGKTGDVAGNIYSTDIKAYINDVQVNSYNIGGKTVVIAEEIAKLHTYNNDLRVLILEDINPQYIVGSQNANTEKAGVPIGKIYETDIKTYFRGKELTSYSLNGKMAVVVEELGDDNSFSDIGGKYVWSENERTLCLESMYRYPYSLRTLLEDNHFNIQLTDCEGGIEAKVTYATSGGYILYEKEMPENIIIPILHKGETIGYKCSFTHTVIDTDEKGFSYMKNIQTPVEYFYLDKTEKMILDASPASFSMATWEEYLKLHKASEILDSFETEEYMFFYTYTHIIHGGTHSLLKINKKDNTKTYYDRQFEPVSLYGILFENVSIDKENEKVYLHYDTDYEINLKTDEIIPLEEKENFLLKKSK